jgi:hypothetical protein
MVKGGTRTSATRSESQERKVERTERDASDFVAINEWNRRQRTQRKVSLRTDTSCVSSQNRVLGRDTLPDFRVHGTSIKPTVHISKRLDGKKGTEKTDCHRISLEENNGASCPLRIRVMEAYGNRLVPSRISDGKEGDLFKMRRNTTISFCECCKKPHEARLN